MSHPYRKSILDQILFDKLVFSRYFMVTFSELKQKRRRGLRCGFTVSVLTWFFSGVV